MPQKFVRRPLCQAVTVAALVAWGAPSAPTLAAPQDKPAAPITPQQREVIRRSVDLVRTDVIVRNGDGQFESNLKKEDFDVFEDGVKQEVVSFSLTHGGRG